jgi:hypothetical protein
MHLTEKVSLALVVTLLVAPAALNAQRAEGSFERTFSVSGPVQLNVENGSGRVQVRGGANNSVVIRARVVANAREGDGAALVREVEQNPPVRQTGNIISIGNPVRRVEKVSINYEITVPQATQGKVSSGSGDVDCAGINGPLSATSGSGNVIVNEVSGSVNARSGSGNVRVSATGGGLKAETGSGNVEVSNVTGATEASTGSGNISVSGVNGAVRANTGSGDLHIARATQEVNAQTGSGNVEVEGVPKAARWNVTTGSGNVRLRVPQGTGFELDASAASGRISTTHQVQWHQQSPQKNHMRGVAGSGETKVVVRAASGNIRVE